MKSPFLPLHGLPWGDPTVQGGGREVGDTACQLGGGHRAECGPHPRFGILLLGGLVFRQLDLPLFQPAGAFSSPGALGGTEGSQEPLSAWASPGPQPLGLCREGV